MPETRRKYDPEFKEGAVRIVRETGKPIAQIARDLGVHEGTLGNWVAKDRAEREGTEGLSKGDAAELKRLRAENAQLRMERDVLKRSVVLWVLCRHNTQTTTWTPDPRSRSSWSANPPCATGSGSGVLAALDQRIAVRYAIAGMSAADTADYIGHHCKIAGRADTLFSDDAIGLIHNASRGHPRAVNNLALHALTAAFAADHAIVDEKAARIAISETAAD